MSKKLLTSFTFILMFFLVITSQAQELNLPKLDPSPADMTYLRASRNSPPIARIIYGRPQKKGRLTFGVESPLAPLGKLWRTGANETTELIVYKDITLGGNKVKAGEYSLYTIPGEKEWTIILNSKLYTWGHFQYDESQDVLRFSAGSKANQPLVEAFTILFTSPEEGSSSSALYLAWDTTIVEIPVGF